MSIIQIFMHGLIALIPASGPGAASNYMTALLVDASKPHEGQIDTQCFVAHKAMLRVHAESSVCNKAHCSASGLDTCTCELARKEVILPEALPTTKMMAPFRSHPQGTLPFDSAEASDLSFVANLSHMGHELDLQYLAPVPPKRLIARMTFPYETIDACSLGTRPDEASENVHPLSFRKIGSAEGVGEPSHAMAQAVAVTFDAGEAAPQVILKDLDNGSSTMLSILPTNGAYRIVFMNERMSDEGGHSMLPLDDPCDDGVERDFAFFYDLVKNPPAWVDRPVPHIKYTRWKSFNDLRGNPICEQVYKDKAPNSHPICAMASFITASSAEN